MEVLILFSLHPEMSWVLCRPRICQKSSYAACPVASLLTRPTSHSPDSEEPPGKGALVGPPPPTGVSPPPPARSGTGAPGVVGAASSPGLYAQPGADTCCGAQGPRAWGRPPGPAGAPEGPADGDAPLPGVVPSEQTAVRLPERVHPESGVRTGSCVSGF